LLENKKRVNGEAPKHLERKLAKKLQTIPNLKPSWWKRIGDEVSDKIRVHTQKKKLDVDGKGFGSYSSKYAKAKRDGKFKRQSSKSTKPDLTLTGDMMRNLQVRTATPNGVVIGWSGTDAEKVQWNARQGREILKDKKPLASDIERYIMRELDKQIEKNLKAVEDTKTIIIGK